MKKIIILLPGILLCGMYVLLGSNAAGPASAGNGIRNGGPGSNGTCSACHGGGVGTTTVAIALKVKATGVAANASYMPGTVYTVTISGTNSNLAFLGFQLTATAGAIQAGTFSNVGSDKHITNISGLQVVEHSTSLAQVNGAYEASFDWTAPAAGAGNISFNAIINGVNADGGTSGDRSSNPATLTLTEGTPLPVTFTRFEATLLHDQAVQLQWETAMEQNARDFIIQQSTDAIHFNSVGIVAAAGNTQGPSAYTFLSQKIIQKTFFRLKQSDRDGQVVYSKVIMANPLLHRNAVLVYPNPAGSTVSVTAEEAINKIAFYNLNGYLVKTVKANERICSVSTADLARGSYIVMVYCNTCTYCTALVKR